MAIAAIQPTSLSQGLRTILEADDIQPGDAASYETCKAIYAYHPLGVKMTESPVRLAQSQDREISIPGAPEEELIEQFRATWREMEMDAALLNVRTQARIYGLAGLGYGEVGKPHSEPVNLRDTWKNEPYLNAFDPLNIPGLITNQDPNSPHYQKPNDVRVNGQLWHRSRVKVIQNESPIYILWTTSAYAYAGRSCFQRCLYPLRSFLNTMITDDMVSRKAGLIVQRMEGSGSIVDRIGMATAALRRWFTKAGRTGEVLGIGLQESIESINLRNVDASMREARNNIIKNIATGNDQPAKLLTQEAYVEGFGEGTEDAKAVSQYIDRLRIEMAPEYAFADIIVQRRAWNPEFYETIRRRYPDEYGDVEYDTAFAEWRNRYKATWPSLIKEEPSKLIEVDKAKMESVIAVLQVVAPLLQGSPEAMAKVMQFTTDVINSLDHMFDGAQLDLDFQDLVASFEASQAERQFAGGNLEEEESSRPRHPFASTDSAELLNFVRQRAGTGRIALR